MRQMIAQVTAEGLVLPLPEGFTSCLVEISKKGNIVLELGKQPEPQSGWTQLVPLRDNFYFIPCSTTLRRVIDLQRLTEFPVEKKQIKGRRVSSNSNKKYVYLVPERLKRRY